MMNRVFDGGRAMMLQCRPIYRAFVPALAALALSPACVFAVEPVLDMFGFDLDTSAAEVRNWLASQGFKPTETNTPRAKAYVRRDASAGQGIGFVPAEKGLDVLFVNQNGITISVDDVVARIEARYGEPRERQTTERGYRLSYDLNGSTKSGQMVWAVQRGFVGVELTSDAYLSPPGGFSRKKLLNEVLASLRASRLALLATIGGGIVLFLLHRALPVRARRFVSNVLHGVLYPVVQALGFLGSRLFTLVFGLLLIPLFVFSGCAAAVSAVEQGTSWLWIIPWVVGAILAIESRDSDEFRYVILADLIFVGTAVGVLLQLSLAGDG